MGSIYYLGWPGMELLPCIIVDQKSREMYHSAKPLPSKKVILNTSENRYVEFARILSLFPIDKQQEAMNTFMGISSDFCVRKFFMDNNQKAYISVDTLLIYVMVYPKCRAFTKARQQAISYLAEWLDYPCLECGFIKRSGCLCNEDNPCDGAKTESIGYCTETIDRQVQTDPGPPRILQPMTSHAHALAGNVQQPPAPPIVPTFMPQGLHYGNAVTSLTSASSSSAIPSARVVNVITSTGGSSVPMTVLSGDAPQSRAVVLPNVGPIPSGHESAADLIVKQAAHAVARSLLRVPPMQAVAPFPPIKPRTRDVGIQTRANFDFTPRSRGKKVYLDDAGAAAAAEKATGSEQSSSTATPTPAHSSPAKPVESSSGVSSSASTSNTPGSLLPSLSVASLPTSQSQPIKVSLWKLLDSDSSDDEDGQKQEKPTETIGSKSEHQEKVENTETNNEQKQETERAGEENTIGPTPSTSKEDTGAENEESNKSNSKSDGLADQPNYQGSFLDYIEKRGPSNKPKAIEKETSEADTPVSEVQNENSETVHTKKDGEMDSTVQSNAVVTDSGDTETIDTVEPVSDSITTDVEVPVDGKETKKTKQQDIKYKEADLSGANETVLSTLLDEEKHEQEAHESENIETSKPDVMETSVTAVVAMETSTSEQAEESTKSSKEQLDTDKRVETEDLNENKEVDGKKDESAMEVDSEDQPLTIDLSETEKGENKIDNDELKEQKGEDENKQDSKESAEASTSDADTKEVLEAKSEEKNKSEEKEKGQRKKWYHKFEYVPTKEQLYRCTFKRCGQCFDSRKAAELHNRVHGLFGQEDPINLTCYQCEYKTPMSRWFDMVRHLRETHEVFITQDPLGCHFCGKILEDDDALLKHVDFHYMGRYKCIYCGALGFTWKQMENHMDILCTLKGKREKNLGCPYCPLVFHIRNMRNAHMMAHTDKGLCCVFCKDSHLWENWTELRKHYQQKHSDKIRSDLQPYKFSRRPALINIMKNPQCHVCNHECTTHEDYVYHMRKKHDFIPYVLSCCEVCEKTFKSQKMYDWHMKHTHGNEVKCPKCDYTARNDMQLKAHDQSQHQAKEYECMECGKEFRFYHQLRMHMAHHALHTIYNCNECGAEFKRQKDQRAHVKKEHPKQEEKPMSKCPDCDYECYTKRSLELHIKRSHPKLAEEIAESEIRAVPAMPEHSYFNTKASPPEGEVGKLKINLRCLEMPPPPPRSKSSSSRKDSFGKKKKGKKSQKHKVPYSADLDENGEPILTEKRRLQIEMREQVERLRALVKETAARTRTYEENKALKQVKKRKTETQEATTAVNNTTTVEPVDEPDTKRQRVSKYGRSISKRTYDKDDIYIRTHKAFFGDHKEKKPARERYRPGEGISPPLNWLDEATTHYPYLDHCYFTIDVTQTMTHSQDYQALLHRESSGGNYPKEYANLRRQSQDDGPYIHEIDVGDSRHNAPGQSRSSQPMQSYRIGPYGSFAKGSTAKHGYSAKQQPYHRRFSPKTQRHEFMPLHDTKLTHDIITIQAQNQDHQDDMRFDDIDNELIKEVAKDPLLQGIIDSMDPQTAHGLHQGSPSKSGFSQSISPMQSRSSMPPSSLNLSNSVANVLPPITPPSTPIRGQSAATSGINPGAGLTPTKQSVLDLLLSKIELNEDQLNKLIEEQGQGDLSNVGNLNSNVSDLIGQSNIAQPVGPDDAMDQQGPDVLSLEQLTSGNIASITRISNTGNTSSMNQIQTSNLSQSSSMADQQVPMHETQPMESENQLTSIDDGHAVGNVKSGEQVSSESQNVAPMDDRCPEETGSIQQTCSETERHVSQGSTADAQTRSEQIDELGEMEQEVMPPDFTGGEDIPIANEEVRVHAGSDTDSNPDLETEMIQHGIVPPSPVIPQSRVGDRFTAHTQRNRNLATSVEAVESTEHMQYDESSAQEVTGDALQSRDAVRGYMQSTEATDIAVASIPLDIAPQTVTQVRTISSPIQQPEYSQSQNMSQYRAITMSDGKGGTMRKIVRLLNRDISPGSMQGITLPAVASNNQVASISGQQMGISGIQSIVPAHQASGVRFGSVAQPTQIVRRVVPAPSQQQTQVVRRVVQIVNSQANIQTSRVITGPTQPQVIRVGTNQQPNLAPRQRFVMPRGRPPSQYGSQRGIRIASQATRPSIISRPGPVGQIRVGAPPVRTYTAAPSASANVIRIAGPNNQTTGSVTIVTRQPQEHDGSQQ